MMLGIIFTGGAAPDTKIIKRILENAGKDTLIVAADSGLDAAVRAGVKPDWIIGDMDSIEEKAFLDTFAQDRVIRHQHDKDYTDTELAFLLTQEKGCDRVWIIGGGGSTRVDHLFGIRCLFEREVFPHRWITESADIYCIDADCKGNSQLSLNAEKEASVAVFPLGDKIWKAKSKGLKWSLDDLTWNRGFFGLSNVALDGDFSITAINGRFMVILQL
ncbi:MAG: thiamine diphosphokinase [Treponema sp.]|nr:thiamine diphosphokinase [Treponema sp.]